VRVLYLDLVSGASGDMLLGALLDAGADASFVQEALDGLDLPGWDLDRREVVKNGIRATKVKVLVTDDTTSRKYADIKELIAGSRLPHPIARLALETFELLATAEAKVHGTSVTDVHLHEVGGHDAIVDIVGTVAAFVNLAPELVVASPVPTGRGWVEAAHGRLPIPAPAVVELLQGVPLLEGGDGELVTPTGAALLRVLVDRFGAMPEMFLSSVGYGAGDRDLPRPNVLRAMLGDTVDGSGENQVSAESSVVVEANLDDMSPELFPHVIDMLLAAGAADAWVTPIVMKKGRPAFTLSALVTDENVERVRDVFFRETTTFGVRSYAIDKQELERSWVEVEVEGHPLRVKIGRRGGSTITVSPEHDDALKVARVTGLPLKDVYARATESARSLLG
jgi:hypothetical protein